MDADATDSRTSSPNVENLALVGLEEFETSVSTPTVENRAAEAPELNASAA